MPPRDSRRNQLALHLEHCFRHLAQAIEANANADWCTVRAHLTEAQIDLRWAKRNVDPLCEHYAAGLE